MGDARRFSRVPFHVHAEINTGGKVIELDSLDISLKGILVYNNQMEGLDIGQHYPLSLKLAGSDITLSFDGKLVHHHIDVIGFSFELMDLDTATHLRKILEANLGDTEAISHELEFLKE